MGSRKIWRWRAAALGWMALIFLMSSTLMASDMEFDSTEDFFGPLNYVVRKCAHVTEYGILTFLWFKALWSDRKRIRKAVVSAAAIATCYAATDEYHQSFVPERSGRVSDVVLDGFGAALTGAGILWLHGKKKLKFEDEESEN